MALQSTIQSPHGITVKDAYHRVENVAIQEKTRIRFEVRSYQNKEPGFPWFNELILSCPYDLNGANPIAQAYAHIKTLPEFENATDC